MKKIRMSLLFSLLLPIIAGSGASNVFSETTLSEAKKDSKILVAYFSRADENYGVGVVKKGNTQILAEFIVQELKIGFIPHSNPYALPEKLQGKHKCRFGGAEKECSPGTCRLDSECGRIRHHLFGLPDLVGRLADGDVHIFRD